MCGLFGARNGEFAKEFRFFELFSTAGLKRHFSSPSFEVGGREYRFLYCRADSSDSSKMEVEC